MLVVVGAAAEVFGVLLVSYDLLLEMLRQAREARTPVARLGQPQYVDVDQLRRLARERREFEETFERAETMSDVVAAIVAPTLRWRAVGIAIALAGIVLNATGNVLALA